MRALIYSFLTYLAREWWFNKPCVQGTLYWHLLLKAHCLTTQAFPHFKHLLWQHLTARNEIGIIYYNGTPLQYSCLGNPMDGGAWWAAALCAKSHRVGHDWSDLAAAAALLCNKLPNGLETQNYRTTNMYYLLSGVWIWLSISVAKSLVDFVSSQLSGIWSPLKILLSGEALLRPSCGCYLGIDALLCVCVC